MNQLISTINKSSFKVLTKNVTLFVSVLTLFFGLNSFSQNRNLSFKHLSIKNGLSQNGVMAIFKDSKGYMWFGTRDGLNMYDGYEFTIYRHDDIKPGSISNNFISTIKEDGNGILWIGTNNGLNSFNRATKKFTTYTNNPNDNTSISNNFIISILCTKEGDIWVGTENGLNLKTKNSKSFEKFFNTAHNPTSISSNKIITIFQDSKKNIWIGTETGGLNKFVKNDKQFISYKHNPSNPNSIASNNIISISESNDHRLWIGTGDKGISILEKNGKFSHIERQEKSKNTLSSNIIRKIVFDEFNNVWIATFDGLNYYNPKTNKFEVYKNTSKIQNSISHNSIRSLFLDNQGFLWAGTYFGGLNLLNLKSKQFKHFQYNPTNKESISYNVVGPMVEDDKKNIWIGTEGGGLNYFNYENQTFEKVSDFYGKKMSSKTIKSLLIDKNKNLWIGTYLDGLLLVDFKNKTSKKFTFENENVPMLAKNSVVSLLEDHSGKIWIGTESGLNLYDPKKQSMVAIPLRNGANPIMCLHEDRKKNIWIGTKLHGLVLLEKGTIKHFINDPKNPKSISHNSIYTIFEDSKNQLWFGTYGGGLDLLNKKTGGFDKFRVRDGLVNDIVYNIIEDNKNNLWLSSPNGISNLNPTTKNIKNYTTNNGLPIEEFNIGSSLKHSQGEIFFGGFNGMMNFYPEKIQGSRILPNLRFTELKLSNKNVSPNDNNQLLTKPLSETESITFTHNQNIFTIEYTAVNFEDLGQNQYAYKLEGLEKDWNYVENKRSATYTNLEEGKYTFKVKAANNDGIWNEKSINLKIVKLPPYWKTFEAYFIYMLILAGLFMVIKKYFLIKLNLENNLKLEKLEKQQIEDLIKLKLKFFTNISHDFRTPLTLIHAPLQELIEANENNESQGHLLLIRKNVNFMLRLINQLMDFRKLETSSMSLCLVYEPITPLIKEIMYSFQEQAKAQKIKFLFISKIAESEFYFDRDKIEKILYNLLSNAFKHTPDNGNITVEIYTNMISNDEYNNFMEISIKNTGHGIQEKNLDSIFSSFFQENEQDGNTQSGTGIGLSLVKNLIEIHKGYVNVKSEIDKQTEFIIGIPINDIYKNEEKLKIQQHWDIEKKEKQETPTHSSDNCSKKIKKHSVLVVEDNNDLRNFLVQTLSNEYEVFSAENGEIGLNMSLSNKPNVIISDIMMPIMNGLELCEKLKNNPKTSHIPIILLTARNTKTIELDSYNTGANDFISKPFDIKLLKSKIHSIINSTDSIKNRSRNEIFLNDSEINNNTGDEEFLKKISNFIRDNITDTDLNVNKTGIELGISRVHLYRKIKKITGKTPVEFIKDFRLNVAVKLLEQNIYNINEVCYKVGFQDVGYFRKCFKKKHNITASEFVSKSKKIEIN
jgi:ligand-binding sensor domain-containing protein/signal transduction histidine kinase/DNA-binding NarL/FixJ family response regulator